jgi:hypothetical protein
MRGTEKENLIKNINVSVILNFKQSEFNLMKVNAFRKSCPFLLHIALSPGLSTNPFAAFKYLRLDTL